MITAAARRLEVKLNPGAALEEPEHQGIRSINAQAPS